MEKHVQITYDMKNLTIFEYNIRSQTQLTCNMKNLIKLHITWKTIQNLHAFSVQQVENITKFTSNMKNFTIFDYNKENHVHIS